MKEYDPDKLRAYVEEHIADWPEAVKRAAREDIFHHADDERDVRSAMREFIRDGHEFVDTWEADFSSYTYRFIWCCRAIVWAIKQYDAAQAAQSPVPPKSPGGERGESG